MSRIAQFAWSAGFLEGEGSFSASRNSPAVHATQKQREPLERLQHAFGGKIYSVRGGQYWMWSLYGVRAVEVIFTLYGMLSPRRKEQARAALLRWKSAPWNVNAHRAKTHCPYGHPYTGENLMKVISKGYASRRCRACRDARNASRKAGRG